jgi:hypothetical protein
MRKLGPRGLKIGSKYAQNILMPAAFEAADTKKFVTTLVKQKINYHE